MYHLPYFADIIQKSIISNEFKREDFIFGEGQSRFVIKAELCQDTVLNKTDFQNLVVKIIDVNQHNPWSQKSTTSIF